MTPRLVACDIDGTLLRTDGTLSPVVRDAVRDVVGAGLTFVLATGRPLAITVPVAEELGVTDWIISANGAVVAEGVEGRVVLQRSVAGEEAAEVMRALRVAVPGIGFALNSDRPPMFERGFDVLAPMVPPEAEWVDDATPGPGEDVHSIVAFLVGSDVHDLLRVAEGLVPDGIEVAPSGLPGSIEITPPGGHKGAALAELCADLGLGPADVVAFGDGLNDLTMLRWAGLGLAMANAEDAVKAVADDVAPPNDEDGVAAVLRRWVPATRS